MKNQFVPKFRKGDVLINVDGHGNLTKDKEYIADSDSFVESGEEFVWVNNNIGLRVCRFVHRFILKQQPVKEEEMKEIKVGDVVICANRRGLEHLIGRGEYAVHKMFPDGRLKLNEFPYLMRSDRFQVVAPKKEVPPVEKKVVPTLLEELDVKANGNPGTATYAIRGEKGATSFQVRDVCHARLYTANGYDGNKIPAKEKVTEVALYLKGHVTDKDKQGAWKMFVDYVINRSPVAKCFITKDAQQAVDLGVMMDVNQHYSDLATAAIFLRTGSEYQHSCLNSFKQVVDLGFSENVAYLYSQWFVTKECIRYQHQHGGHHVINSRMDKEEFVQFFKKGLFKNNGDPYAFNHATRYRIFDSIAKESQDNIGNVFKDLFSNLPNIHKEDHWGELTYKLKLSLENTVRVCNMISRVID